MNDEPGVTPAIPNPSEASASSAASDRDSRIAQGALCPGDLIADKYKFERILGSGGMGLVLRATHVDLNRPVAIKVVRGEFLQNEEIVARMLSEAQLAASIRSEHVARVLDLGRMESGAPYIVFEYLEGRDLAQLLNQRGALPHESAVDFILQVCDALAEAHAAGIVHRDLKPENMFLTESADGAPVVKVLDFGISKKLSTRDRRAVLTGPLQVMGSPYYMAPEQMRSGQTVDARADIWALGVVLYELCTGQTPFSADSVPGVCAMVLDENPVPPSSFAPELPRGLERIILRCLRKQPERRYQSVAELAEGLVHFGSEQAKSYAERIGRVIGSSRLAERSSRPDHLATQRSIPAGRAPTKSLGRAEVGVVDAPLSLAATVRAQQRARLGSSADLRQAALVVATAAGISMLASMALFEFANRSEKPELGVRTASAAAPAAPRLSAAPEPPKAPEPAESLEPDEPLPAASSAQREPGGERPACAERPKPRVVRPRAAPRPALLPAAEPDSPEAPKPDAFDPSNFGGRQ